MLVDDRAPGAGDLVERLVPRDAAQALIAAHLRVQQAAVQAHRLAQRRTLDAQATLVRRVQLVAGDGDRAVALGSGAHTATDAAIGAGGTD